MMLAAAGMSSAQDVLKPLELRNSKAESKNAEAIRLFRQGKFKQALALIDDAAGQDTESPIPWINGSLINLELGNLAQAFKANREARLMGDRSNRRMTLDSEIETARGQLGKSWRSIEASEFQNPEDPYVHMARAKFADAAANRGMAERSRWQAYRSGKTVLMDSKEFSDSTYDVTGGVILAGWLDGKLTDFSDRNGVTVQAHAGTETLGGSLAAQQSALKADVSAATKVGTFMGSYRLLGSDRPGLFLGNSSIPSSPGARLQYDYRMFGWQKSMGNLTLNANYREADSNLRAVANGPYLRDNFQTQWMLESRYDKGAWTGGAGLSKVYRSSVVNPAIEPLEDVFGQGNSQLSHGYLVHRTNLGHNARLIAGAVVSKVDDKTNVLATAELAVRMIGDRYLRIGVKPTMDRAGTVLFPEDLRSREIGSNPIDRTFGSSLDSNRGLNLFSSAGKSADMYASMPLIQAAAMSLSMTAFQRQFTNALFLTGNSQLQSSLALASIPSGRVSGLTAVARSTPSRSLEISLASTVQSSRGTYALSPDTQLPNLPNFSSALTVDMMAGQTSYGLALNYVGDRLQALNGPIVGTEKVPHAWGIDLNISQPTGSGVVHLSALNLARQSFFAGSRSAPTVALTYGSKY